VTPADGAAPRAEGRPPRVRVRMAAAAVAGLRRGAYALYVFRALATAGTAFPLVWQRRETMAGEMDVVLDDGLRVFASAAAIGEGTAICGGGEYPARTGQTLEVMSADGRGPVEPRGAPGMVTVVNVTNHQMVCGLAAPVEQGFARSCALPLYARHACVVAPLDRVLLAIAPVEVRAGCVLMRAPGEAVLVDLSGGEERCLDYDRVRGWSWARGEGWARVHPAGSSLVSLLVERTPELRDARAAVLDQLAHPGGWRG
jgi:hypothetical protein